MNRIVVASAASFETDTLVASLNAAGIDVTRLTTGIGLTESCIIASRCRDLVMGRHVIFCCTGGVIGTFNSINIFQATSVRLGSHDIRNEKSYLLDTFDPEIKLSGLNLNLPTCEVFGSLGVSKALEEGFEPKNQLETLELYGIARAWTPVSKTFTAIIGSTNATGPMAHTQWVANFKTAAAMTSALLIPEILRLAITE